MDDLTYSLRQLCQRNRDGSYTTQADRMRSLSLAARQLREAGFRQMKASSLKGKHVQALLERWQGEACRPALSRIGSLICAGGPRRSERPASCQRTTCNSA